MSGTLLSCLDCVANLKPASWWRPTDQVGKTSPTKSAVGVLGRAKKASEVSLRLGLM